MAYYTLDLFRLKRRCEGLGSSEEKVIGDFSSKNRGEGVLPKRSARHFTQIKCLTFIRKDAQHFAQIFAKKYLLEKSGQTSPFPKKLTGKK